MSIIKEKRFRTVFEMGCFQAVFQPSGNIYRIRADYGAQLINTSAESLLT